jgi:hypothetical protein
MNEEEVNIAYEILKYLIDNPNAQDTLEGIVQWWLPEGTVKRQAVAVREALSVLAADHLVLAREGKDSRIRYKINGRRRAKILSLLQQRRAENHPADW